MARGPGAGPGSAITANAIGRKTIRIGGAPAIEIRARNIFRVRGFIGTYSFTGATTARG